MRSVVGRSVAAMAAGAAILSLAACDGGASAVASRDHSATTDVTMASSAQGSTAARIAAPAVDPRTQPVRQVDGKPVWAPNRRLTADEAAKANFERNGGDFGVKSADACVTKTHDFVENPPRGAQRITRANGDVLIYDAKENVFAVVTSDGAPRTMFKPREGAAYWDKQKATETARLAKADRKASDEG